MQQLSEKPHLGFATKKTAWNPGPNVCNFTVTLGLQVAMVENGVRKTYSARYYNPATGRFMSRDPENGKAKDPKTLHKYLYASGDPVNRIDPSGRGDLVELSLQTWNAIKNALAEEEELHMVRKVFQCIAEMLSMIGYEPAELSDWMIEGCIESL
jgi:RHS repeat-associated protein